MTPMKRQKIFSCKTSSYSQTTERKPLKPGHVFHEAQYYLVTVTATRCNAQYSFKTTRLKKFLGRTFYVCVYGCMYGCMCVCMRVCVCVCIMYACMYVRMYECM